MEGLRKVGRTWLADAEIFPTEPETKAYQVVDVVKFEGSEAHFTASAIPQSSLLDWATTLSPTDNEGKTALSCLKLVKVSWLARNLDIRRTDIQALLDSFQLDDYGLSLWRYQSAGFYVLRDRHTSSKPFTPLCFAMVPCKASSTLIWSYVPELGLTRILYIDDPESRASEVRAGVSTVEGMLEVQKEYIGNPVLVGLITILQGIEELRSKLNFSYHEVQVAQSLTGYSTDLAFQSHVPQNKKVDFGELSRRVGMASMVSYRVMSALKLLESWMVVEMSEQNITKWMDGASQHQQGLMAREREEREEMNRVLLSTVRSFEAQGIEIQGEAKTILSVVNIGTIASFSTCLTTLDFQPHC
jgi:hypothetical protein